MILILNIISTIFVLLNTFFTKNTLFGVSSFVFWLFTTGFLYKELLNKFFKNIKYSFLFGILTSFYLLMFFGSIFTVFYKITLLFFIISLILTTIFPLFFLLKDKKFLSFKLYNLKLNKILKIKNLNIDLLFLMLGIIISSFFVLYYLFLASSGDYNIYPFNNTFPLLWVLYFFLLCFVIFFILKWESRIESKKYFFIGVLLIIFTSFIFHSHLPIVYEAGFGGDRLRHTATEKFLQEGNIVTPSLFGSKENISLKKIGNLEIPEVIIVGNKQSYGNKWTADIFLSWIINKDCLYVDKYLIFIIWSIFIPLIFINIFKNFSENNKFVLLFSISSIFLSPLLIFGSQSDPRSFGLIPFLFILSLFINKIKEENINKKIFITIFFVFIPLFLYMNYIVFLIIYLIFLLSYLFSNKKLKIIYILFSSLFILILDLFSGSTYFLKQSFLGFLSKFGLFFSNLLSLNDYTNDIYESSRNFIYFKNFLNLEKINSPWLVNFAPIFSIIFLFIIILGIYHFYKSNFRYRFVINAFYSIFLSYFLSFVMFDGVRIFAKRTEVIISILFLVFFVNGLIFLFEKIKNKINLEIFIIIFCSLLSVSALFSGPIMENATRNDFEAAKWLFSQIKNDEKYCVIGNTWPLLALEYESGRKIVTGGFPQGFEYSQKERVYIFNKLIKNPSKEYLEEAKKTTGANKCFLMLKDDYIKSAYFGNIDFIGIHKKYIEILDVFKSNKNIGDVKIFIEK